MRVVAGSFPKRLADSLQAPSSGGDSMQMLHLVVDIVNGSDSYTSGHSTRVSEMAAVVAKLADCTPAQVDVVRRAAAVHDIGKIGVPEKVLRKHGPLNAEERRMVNLHPIFGASMLARVPEAADLVPAVLHHHEHWDGSGYPGRLSMMDIPLPARIISVADAFDAMTSYRTYGPALTPEAALQELRKCSGSQFDPRLVEAMHDAFSYGLLERRKATLYPQTVGQVLT
jgi:HD-GYP domain-containing protein (c-di-GMP phosphodiesterase class II)